MRRATPRPVLLALVVLVPALAAAVATAEEPAWTCADPTLEDGRGVVTRPLLLVQPSTPCVGTEDDEAPAALDASEGLRLRLAVQGLVGGRWYVYWRCNEELPLAGSFGWQRDGVVPADGLIDVTFHPATPCGLLYLRWDMARPHREGDPRGPMEAYWAVR